MLKKLRHKFVMINMSIITIILCTIAALLYLSTAASLRSGSQQMIEAIAANPMLTAPPNARGGYLRLPYFTVRVNLDGEIVSTGGGYFSMDDTAQTESILEECQRLDTDSGDLHSYRLRFLRVSTPQGQNYVFIDTSTEHAILQNLLRNLLLLIAVSFLVFWVISILLAKWAVKPVEKAWKQQKQFVSDASHELKTPLTVILTDSELLNAPDLTDADRRSLASAIHVMSEQMQGLVENLLDLARIDNHSVKEERTAVSCSEIFSEAAMLFEPLFFEKGLTFSYQIEDGITLEGYPGHLKQLADILLDNAAKYASPGGNVQMRVARQPGRKLVLEVANEGDPISPDDLPRLFERFYRADPARTVDHSYGLGLSIAKGIAEEHKGSIRAESKDGVNRFLVEI